MREANAGLAKTAEKQDELVEVPYLRNRGAILNHCARDSMCFDKKCMSQLQFVLIVIAIVIVVHFQL